MRLFDKIFGLDKSLGRLTDDSIRSQLLVLKGRLEREGLFPILSVGDSHSAWAQWFAYEAIDCYKVGQLNGASKYMATAFDELRLLRELKPKQHRDDLQTGESGAIEGVKYMWGLKK